MKSARFDYVVANTVAEAAALLTSAGASAAIIAGGQSLVPMLNLRVAAADVLVDISCIEELKTTRETPAGLLIGALTTHADIEDGKIPDLFGGLLRDVAAGISYRAIRNYGTIGGSVALADPAADWPVCLMALGADVCIAAGETIRSQPIANFIQGQYTTALGKNEIVVGLDVPRPDAQFSWGFRKVVRKSGAFADSIAVVAQRGGNVSIALGGAVPRPFPLAVTAKQLGDGKTSDGALRAAITQDLTAQVPQADAYLMRLHTSTILHAVREMRSR
jgi:aerobic carbon-monoxide dehydrogenase medium subunit